MKAEKHLCFQVQKQNNLIRKHTLSDHSNHDKNHWTVSVNPKSELTRCVMISDQIMKEIKALTLIWQDMLPLSREKDISIYLLTVCVT